MVPLVDLASDEKRRAVAVHFPEQESASVRCAVGPSSDTLSVDLPVLKRPFEAATVCHDENSVAVFFVTGPVPRVCKIRVGVLVGAEPIALVENHFSIKRLCSDEAAGCHVSFYANFSVFNDIEFHFFC